VTGLLLFVEGLPSKQLELVLDLIPAATKIGLVVNPDNVNSLSQREELESAVAAKAMKIATVEVRTPEKVDFDLPDTGERTGGCGYRVSGHGVLH
jgi:putative tryptophan/tyrosine transport system substrate-binding protein